MVTVLTHSDIYVCVWKCLCGHALRKSSTYNTWRGAQRQLDSVVMVVPLMKVCMAGVGDVLWQVWSFQSLHLVQANTSYINGACQKLMHATRLMISHDFCHQASPSGVPQECINNYPSSYTTVHCPGTKHTHILERTQNHILFEHMNRFSQWFSIKFL